MPFPLNSGGAGTCLDEGALDQRRAPDDISRTSTRSFAHRAAVVLHCPNQQEWQGHTHVRK